MKRLDAALVEWGLAPSRAKAQALITQGEVAILRDGQWLTVRDNSFNADRLAAADVRIHPEAQALKYVSRGGLKLEAAARHLKLAPRGWRCLDVGLSAGGFTDFLLQSGAACVLGVDVGRAQLHPRLAADPRLTSLEGLNVKDLARDSRVLQWLAKGVDLCVIDLSFISLTLAFPPLSEALPAGAPMLALVKPQFEVGRRIVTEKLFNDVHSRVLQGADKYGFSSIEYFSSPVRGQDGNQEFFLWCRRR